MVNLPPTRPHAPEGPTGRSTRQIASSQASPSTGAVPERSRVPHLTNHVATQVPPSRPPSQGPSCEAETLLDSKLKLYGVLLHTISQKIAERIQSYVWYIMCDVYHLKGTIDIRIQVGGPNQFTPLKSLHVTVRFCIRSSQCMSSLRGGPLALKQLNRARH
jgi:hypothetical protein